MAMTACSVKVLSSVISSSENGFNAPAAAFRVTVIAPSGLPSRMMGTASTLR